MEYPPPSSPYQTTQRIIQLVDESGDMGAEQALREIRRLSQRLDVEIDFEVALAERRGKRQIPSRPKTAKAVTGYSISIGRSGIALTEHRGGTSEPFRVPREHYDTIVREAAELWKQNSRFIFRELSDRLQQSAVMADIHARTAMRFWVSEGLVHHRKARFALVKGKAERFKTVADAQWKKLEAWSMKNDGLPRPVLEKRQNNDS